MKRKVYLPIVLIGCIMLFSLASFGRGHIPVTSAYLQNDTVCTGATAYFVFGAVDTSANPLPTITYAWQLSTNGGTTWSAITTGSPYTISDSLLSVSATTALSGYQFRCIATDSLGSDTSNVALLKVDTASWGSIAGPSSVCLGAHITLSCAIAGGTWSATNDSASVSPAGIVTGLLPNGLTSGHDTILYSLTNACGSKTDTAYVIINPVPATGVISGPSIMCMGSTITLTESLTGGTWSRSHPLVDSFSGTGVVRGISQGFDTIKYTTYNGLCYSSALHPIRVDTTVTALPITGPSVSCVGHTINLTDLNVFGTWIWSASNSHATVNSSGHVLGVTSGLDTITYSFTNACNSVTSTTTVEIDAVLSPGVITGSTYTVCAGSWIHLSESITGGVWISGNSSLAIVDGSGNVTGVAVGTPLISYVVSNGCGDVAATHAVTVSIPASTITGPDSVGIGNTITLSDAATGTSQIWNSGDITIASIGSSSGIVTGVGSGSTMVTYTVTNSCGTTSATKTIYSGPAPYVSLITGPDSVCSGSSVVFTDSVSGGTWSASSDSATVVSSGDSSGTVTGVHYGQVIITYTVSNAFGSNSSEKAVYVNVPPVIAVKGPSLVAMGGDYFLFGYPAGGHWSANNSLYGSIISTGIIDTGIIAAPGDTLHNVPVTYCSYVVTRAGSVTLKYTYTNTCGTRSDTFLIYLPGDHSLTPVVNGSAENLITYPNPNNGEFTINLASQINESVTVTVTNLIGQKVKDFAIQTNQNNSVLLDPPAGVYVIFAVTASGNKYYSKITITK